MSLDMEIKELEKNCARTAKAVFAYAIFIIVTALAFWLLDPFHFLSPGLKLAILIIMVFSLAKGISEYFHYHHRLKTAKHASNQ